MAQPSESQTGSRVLMIAASLVVVIAGLRAARDILVPIVVALFLAVLGLPALVWLQRRGAPKWLAVTLVMGGLLLLIVGIASVIGSSIDSFKQEMPVYDAKLREHISAIVAWLQQHSVKVDSASVFDYLGPKQMLSWAQQTLAQAFSVLSNLTLVVLTMVFVLFEAASFPAKLRAAFASRVIGTERLSRITGEIQNYLAVKTVVSLLTGVLLWLWVWILGIDFPLLWGLLAFLLNYVPNLGSIIAAAPPVLLALIKFGPGKALIVMIGYVVVNTVLGNLIEPQMMGRRLGLSTLVVFLSLVFWGWMWGTVGMLLSVPLTIIVKILLENSDDLRWIAVLLGPEPPSEKT